ncbi:MAG: hypothetical protein PGN15_01640 [Aeromicrobium erythreum]
MSTQGQVQGQGQGSASQWQSGSPRPMQLRVRHTTGFTYAEGAAASYNEARMTPLTTSDQVVLRSRVEVSPTAWSQEYRDYWGTVVTAFEVHEPHDALTVVATSTVESTPHAVDVAPVGWADLAAVSDEWCEFLVLDSWVRPHDDLGAQLDTLRASSDTPGRVRGGRVRPGPRPPALPAGRHAGVDDGGRGVGGRRRGCARTSRTRRSAPASCGDPGSVRVGLPAPVGRAGGRRDRRGRVARVGGVLGRRLARVRPDERGRAGRPARARGAGVGATATARRCAASTRRRVRRSCS